MADKVTMVKQFDLMKTKREIAKKNFKPKGPVDLKEVRAQVKEWNKGNKKPL